MTSTTLMAAAEKAFKELNLPWTIEAGGTPSQYLISIDESVPYTPDGIYGTAFWLKSDCSICPSEQINADESDCAFDLNRFISDMDEARAAGEPNIPSPQQVKADGEKLLTAIGEFGGLMDEAENEWYAQQEAAADTFKDQVEPVVAAYAETCRCAACIGGWDGTPKMTGYHETIGGADGTLWECTAAIAGMDKADSALADAVQEAEFADGEILCASVGWERDGSGTYSCDLKLYMKFWIPFTEEA